MTEVFKNLTGLIGKAPLLELSDCEKKYELQVIAIDELEYFGPAGNARDRIAEAMIGDAEEEGLLNSESATIEPTGGNTGIGLVPTVAAHDYHIVLTIPETISAERRNLLRVYGIELVLTEGAKRMSSTIVGAEELTQETPYSFIPNQFVNPTNPDVHRKIADPETWKDADGKVDILVADVGTGGTLTDAGEFLKSRDPSVRTTTVESNVSPVLLEGESGPHKIQEIGAEFVPKMLSTSIYDGIICAKNEDALATDKKLSKEEGLLMGASSGAAIWATTELAEYPENAGKVIAAVLPDTGERHFSTPLFSG